MHDLLLKPCTAAYALILFKTHPSNVDVDVLYVELLLLWTYSVVWMCYVNPLHATQLQYKDLFAN